MGRCSDARERLLATAAKLLHRRGYTALSVSEICEAAGLKKGSFYHFFDSKQALALATLDGYAAHQGERLKRLLDAPGTVHAKLRAMFQGMYDECRTQKHKGGGLLLGCPLGNLAAEMAGRDEGITAKLESIFAEWQAVIETLLRRGVQTGELDVADPKAAAESVVALIEGAALLARTMSDPGVAERMAHSALLLLRTPDRQPTPA